MTDLTVNEVYAIGAPIVLAMIFVELLISSWQNKKYYKTEDTLCTAGLLAGNIIVAFSIKGLILAFHFYLYQFKIIELASILPLWAMWVLTFVMIDFVFYIYHRMSHRVRFLWAIHLSHHSSEEMNFAVSFRQAWFGPISKIPFFMALPLLGFDPTIIAVAGVISTLWGIVGHTQIVGRPPNNLRMTNNSPQSTNHSCYCNNCWVKPKQGERHKKWYFGDGSKPCLPKGNCKIHFFA